MATGFSNQALIEADEIWPWVLTNIQPRSILYETWLLQLGLWEHTDPQQDFETIGSSHGPWFLTPPSRHRLLSQQRHSSFWLFSYSWRVIHHLSPVSFVFTHFLTDSFLNRRYKYRKINRQQWITLCFYPMFENISMKTWKIRLVIYQRLLNDLHDTHLTFSNELKSTHLVMNIPETLHFHYWPPLDLEIFVSERKQKKKIREKSNSW